MAIPAFESNWGEGGNDGIDKYDFTPCEFCKTNGIFGPDDF